jgi:hypothetical protein
MIQVPLSFASEYDAEIILNERIVSVYEDGQTETLIHSIVRINNVRGVEKYKTTSFGNDSSRGSFEVLCMRRHENSGEDKNLTIELTPFVSQSGDTEISKILVTAPILKPGDIFEYEIRIRKNRPALPGHFWSMQNMADVYPTAKSVFTIEMPEDMQFFYHIVNLKTEPRISNGGGNRTCTWELENLKPVTSSDGEESDAGMPRVIVSTINSWDVMAEWMAARYFEKITNNDRIRKLATSLTQKSGNKNTEQTAIALARFVSLNIVNRNGGIEPDAIVPAEAESVLNERKGDCKDKTVLLVSLLYAVGIEAYPALINTDRNFNISEMLPAPYYFNHALVYVPRQDMMERDLWLDATDTKLTMARSTGISPLNRQQALVLKPNGESRFVWMKEASAE